jgi:hypothetical protein
MMIAEIPARSDTPAAPPQALHPPQPKCAPEGLVPLPPGTPAKPNTPERLRKDLRLLARFILLYCKAHHEHRNPVSFKGYDVDALAGKPIHLCHDCMKLLRHAFVKRTHCPRDPKPQCKHCPTHCYSPFYRQQIREVMRFSGKRLLFRGRIDYLFHLFF